jgi:hypothetical protein
LGNRSLLADPRGAEIKDRVNEIKRRQKFRPFAPVILAELADDYFDMSLVGIVTIICSQSLIAANLMFTLLYVMLMAPVEYKQWRKMDQE